MVILHHIKHKPIGSNASPLIQEFRKGTNRIPDEDDDDEDCDTSEIMSLMGSSLPSFSGTGQCISP